MIRLLSLLLAIGITSTSFAQQATVKLVKGMAAITYKLGEKESSYDVYKRFGMDEATFLLLNQPAEGDTSSLATLPEDMIWVTVANNLLMQCSTGCVTLWYEAAADDNFKKIGSYFGNLNPYYIKQLNPQIEAVSVGKLVQVGYLPSHMLAPGALDVSSIPAAKPSTDSAAVGNAGPPVVPSRPGEPEKKDTATAKVPYSGAGYFSSEFKNGTNRLQGKMGNFKSFGGWYDGKFYILINGVEMGKVVKVTNASNGLVIFAKVVSPLPEIKGEKSTLMARINNAACAALDIWDDNEFEVEIVY
ncbi:MAG TPA: hypothetical protein VLL95_07460 [Phnomibacter sp.]|nr:hypothetical protein [Phnomibacter sp.]